MTNASRPNLSSAPCSKRMLPTDLAIFSESISTMPLCIHSRANGFVRAASVCAISFSWWGNTRSEPPPWISKSTPRISSAMAEHSMCQPGLPSPQGESQAVSSPSLRAFHRAKSWGDSLCSAASSPSPCCISSSGRLESLP